MLCCCIIIIGMFNHTLECLKFDLLATIFLSSSSGFGADNTVHMSLFHVNTAARAVTVYSCVTRN